MAIVLKENSSSTYFPAMLRFRRFRAVTAMMAMTIARIHQRTAVGRLERTESRDMRFSRAMFAVSNLFHPACALHGASAKTSVLSSQVCLPSKVEGESVSPVADPLVRSFGIKDLARGYCHVFDK